MLIKSGLVLTNTTDIPSQLVKIAIAFSIQEGVELNSVTIRNKEAGKVAGNWGRYYPTTREITLCVPRQLQTMHDLLAHKSRQPYSGTVITVKSRAEFLVRVMAHELRHAYQFQVAKVQLGMTRYDRMWRELDAEVYEEKKVTEWRAQFGDLAQAARVAASLR